MAILDLEKIEEFVKNNLETRSETHGFGHLRRTAIGAHWFAKVFGSPAQEQEIAYLAGLIHDLKRPLTEKIDHTESSINEAEKILEKFGIAKGISRKILGLISLHREFSQVPLSSQWVFLADKIFEQSGAFIIFRRLYYVGECEDFKGSTFFEATLPYWAKRSEKFLPEKFDRRIQPLAYYQFKWSQDFINNIYKKKPWAIRLARAFFEYGRQGKKNLEQLIADYQADNQEAKIIKKETLDYLTGKKYIAYAKLLKI